MKNVLAKLKNSKAVKWFTGISVASMIGIMSCFACFAADESSTANVDIGSTLGDSFTTMMNNIMSYIGIVLPIALTVVGAFFGIRKAVSFFKKTAN